MYAAVTKLSSSTSAVEGRHILQEIEERARNKDRFARRAGFYAVLVEREYVQFRLVRPFQGNTEFQELAACSSRDRAAKAPAWAVDHHCLYFG